MDFAALIRDVPDFPIEGILFKDITPVLQNADAFKAAVEALARPYVDAKIDKVVAIEAPLALRLGAGFVPVRKPGKLPSETVQIQYSLEYGTNTLELHTDAIQPGERVLVVDDLLATGGSAKASIELVQRLGGVVVGLAFLVELVALGGAEKLADYEVFSAIKV